MTTAKWPISRIKDHLETLKEGEQGAFIASLAQDPRKGVQALRAQWIRTQERKVLEEKRIEALWAYEDKYLNRGLKRIAGTDEAGRGPLAGPVVAAAVILPRNAHLPGIKDSKKLTPEKREDLFSRVTEQAITYSIIAIEAEQIDRWNILRASEIAMAKALGEVGGVEMALVDGTNQPPIEIPMENILSGDNKCISIAAASILAKVWRDRHMVELDTMYPGYGFADHKGYGTATHYAALERLGPSPVHRRSFRLT